jgi:hypothetical protein
MLAASDNILQNRAFWFLRLDKYWPTERLTCSIRETPTHANQSRSAVPIDSCRAFAASGLVSACTGPCRKGIQGKPHATLQASSLFCS